MKIPEQENSPQERAFLSVHLEYEYTDESGFSPFPVKILLIPPQDIATHEYTDPKEVAHTRRIFIETGWVRRPVAVAGSLDDYWYERIPFGISLPNIPFPSFLFGLLDGHHRREASLGFFPFIPAQIFPLNSEFITIGTWREGEVPKTTDQVREILQSPLNAPSKATKFQILCTDGKLRRIKDIQPRLRFSADILRQIADMVL